MSDELKVTPGASGYFSKPSTHLDPNLFDAHERVRPAVSALITSTLYSFWRGRGLHRPEAWATVYIAGSGASYQWDADRSEGDGKPGDLDILIAVDWDRFYLHEGTLHLGVGTFGNQLATVVEMLDTDLKAHLWPSTAETRIGNATYEMTYYVNPDTGPIEAIHPYAAYSVTENRWAVHPDPNPVHPQSVQDFQATLADVHRTQQLVSEYNSAHARFLDAYRRSADVGAPQMVTAEAELKRIARDARALFDDIHGARNDAFSEHGEGYADNRNFRWQRAKQAGIVEPLKAMAEQASLPPAIMGLVDPAGLITQRLVEQSLRTRR